MTENEVREHIFKILHRIAPEADLDQLDPNQNLREALDMDSFDFLNVLVATSIRTGDVVKGEKLEKQAKVPT